MFGAAMEVADVRLDLRHHLAVGAEHEPEHAVGARVLRPHVDEHLVGADVELDDPGIVVDRAGHAHLPLMPW
jgi:hypothetical protein